MYDHVNENIADNWTVEENWCSQHPIVFNQSANKRVTAGW